MSEASIAFEAVGKKFCRSLPAGLLHGVEDGVRRLFHLDPPERLRREEFWALHEVSFVARRGECLGIIGPNGAGKSTLLKLVNGDLRPDRGRVRTQGRVKSLIRLGLGLQPLFSGRENITIKCMELGLGKPEADGLADAIAAFAGLDRALDQPVKRYSEGMYARLEFSIATAFPADILLIDEVLAVGDFAFQMRALERLDELKRAGTTLLFVSHSEMNVRQIADRCLLLFDGEALACGETDALFRKYYQAVGFGLRRARPIGGASEAPADFVGTAAIRRLGVIGQASAARPRGVTGQPLAFSLDYHAANGIGAEDVCLILEFWSPAGVLLGAFDSRLAGTLPVLAGGGASWRVELPFLPLTAGIYRVGGGFCAGRGWLGYSSNLLTLVVTAADPEVCRGGWVVAGRVVAGNRDADR